MTNTISDIEFIGCGFPVNLVSVFSWEKLAYNIQPMEWCIVIGFFLQRHCLFQ